MGKVIRRRNKAPPQVLHLVSGEYHHMFGWDFSFSSVPSIPFLKFFIIGLYLDVFRECMNGCRNGSEAVRRLWTEGVLETIPPMVKRNHGIESTWISGTSAMTVNAGTMVRIGKEEMTTKLKGNERFTCNISKALLFSFSSLRLEIADK